MDSEKAHEYEVYEVDSLAILNGENCIKIMGEQSQVYETYYCINFYNGLKFGLISEGHGIPPYVKKITGDKYIISMDDKLYIVSYQTGDVTFKVLDSLIFDILFYGDSILIVCELDVYSFYSELNELSLNWKVDIGDVLTGYKLIGEELLIELEGTKETIELSTGDLKKGFE